MTSRRALERRVQSLEQVVRAQGRWFVIECLDGEEDSGRIDRICNQLELEYGPISSEKDEIIIRRVFGDVGCVSDIVLVVPITI